MTSENDQLSIEKEFSASWDWIERYYEGFDTPNYEYLKPIHGLIAELRKRGYDTKLRAGQRLLELMLSRAEKHGLSGQPVLAFYLLPEGGMTVWYFEQPDVRLQIQVDSVVLNAEVEELLMRLLAQPIS